MTATRLAIGLTLLALSAAAQPAWSQGGRQNITQYEYGTGTGFTPESQRYQFGSFPTSEIVSPYGGAVLDSRTLDRNRFDVNRSDVGRTQIGGQRGGVTSGGFGAAGPDFYDDGINQQFRPRGQFAPFGTSGGGGAAGNIGLGDGFNSGFRGNAPVDPSRSQGVFVQDGFGNTRFVAPRSNRSQTQPNNIATQQNQFTNQPAGQGRTRQSTQFDAGEQFEGSSVARQFEQPNQLDGTSLTNQIDRDQRTRNTLGQQNRTDGTRSPEFRRAERRALNQPGVNTFDAQRNFDNSQRSFDSSQQTFDASQQSFDASQQQSGFPSNQFGSRFSNSTGRFGSPTRPQPGFSPRQFQGSQGFGTSQFGTAPFGGNQFGGNQMRGPTTGGFQSGGIQSGGTATGGFAR